MTFFTPDIIFILMLAFGILVGVSIFGYLLNRSSKRQMEELNRSFKELEEKARVRREEIRKELEEESARVKLRKVLEAVEHDAPDSIQPARRNRYQYDKWQERLVKKTPILVSQSRMPSQSNFFNDATAIASVASIANIVNQHSDNSQSYYTDNVRESDSGSSDSSTRSPSYSDSSPSYSDSVSSSSSYSDSSPSSSSSYD